MSDGADDAGAAERAPRRPRRVYGVGDEPDPRFSMANERTALAWVRTALALVAGGAGLLSVAPLTGVEHAARIVAGILGVAGAVMAVGAVLGWARREIALRLRRALPAPTALAWLAVLVVALGALLAWALLLPSP